jgi:signal peptidase I
MSPAIRDGEMITVAPVEAGKIERGDIILYRGVKGIVAHRVMAIRETSEGRQVFVMQGDASRDCDDPVTASHVLGKVVLTERRGKRLELTGWPARMRHYILSMVMSLRSGHPKMSWLLDIHGNENEIAGTRAHGYETTKR